MRSRAATDKEQAFCLTALAEVQRMRLARGAPEDAVLGGALEAAIAFMADW